MEKKKIIIWLESESPKSVKQKLLRFSFNLESYDTDQLYVKSLFSDYVDLDAHLFSTQVISQICQILPPRDCIDIKKIALQKSPNHPIGSLQNFPTNLWSVSN